MVDVNSKAEIEAALAAAGVSSKSVVEELSRVVERAVSSNVDRATEKTSSRDRVDTDIAADERIRAGVARGADSNELSSLRVGGYAEQLLALSNQHIAEQIAASARQTKALEAQQAELAAIRTQQLALMTTRAARHDDVACDAQWCRAESEASVKA